jgi:hypothetical protein
MAKDAGALMEMVAPGFTQQMPDGQRLDYEEAGQLLREWFATPDVVTAYEVKIGSVELNGDRAVADVVEKVVCQFTGPGGKRHERVQTNPAEVTWVLTDGGWRIEETRYRDAKMTVDGVPVSPTIGFSA